MQPGLITIEPIGTAVIQLVTMVVVPLVVASVFVGVTSLGDVARFKDLGAYGIIAGSALYKGRIDFSEAKALAQ